MKALGVEMRLFLKIFIFSIIAAQSHAFAVKEEWDDFTSLEQQTYIRGYLEALISTSSEPWRRTLWQCRMEHQLEISDFQNLLNERWNNDIDTAAPLDTPGLYLQLSWVSFCRSKGYDITIP